MANRREELEQIFETCLAQIQTGHETIDSALARYPEEAEALRPRLEAALWMDERKGSLDPRPGFVSASRSRLVSQIKQDMAAQAAETKSPKESWIVSLWHQLVPQGPGAGKRFAFQLALPYENKSFGILHFFCFGPCVGAGRGCNSFSTFSQPAGVRRSPVIRQKW